MRNNNFVKFSASTRDAFENNENNYVNFSQMLTDYGKGVFQSGITKADADALIKEQFNRILGIDENSKPRDIRYAIEEHKLEIFRVIEETIDNLLTTGWTDNEFFRDFVEIKNLALGDTNEFHTVDESVLTVGKLSGNHWDIDRQQLGYGKDFRVETYWIGLGVYEEMERVMLGRSDWGKLVNAIYTAVDKYVDELVYTAMTTAGSKVLPNSDMFYNTGALSQENKADLLEMIENVQGVNRGAEVVIMGTKSALSRLSNLVPVDWRSETDKEDHRNTGHVGIWEGTRVVEIPQVFAKNDLTTKLVDPNVLLIMPLVDNKFVKLVYEGDSRVRAIEDNTTLNDMTYEFKYMTKLGVSTLIGRYFGTWNIETE